MAISHGEKEEDKRVYVFPDGKGPNQLESNYLRMGGTGLARPVLSSHTSSLPTPVSPPSFPPRPLPSPAGTRSLRVAVSRREKTAHGAAGGTRTSVCNLAAVPSPAPLQADERAGRQCKSW